MEKTPRKKIGSHLPRALARGKLPKANLVLLGFTILMIFVVPVFTNNNDYISYILITGIFVSTVSLLRRYKTLLFSLSVILPLGGLFGKIIGIEFISDFFRFTEFFFFIFLVGSLILRISRKASVTLEVIIEAIVGYLLLGFAFTIIVTLISIWIPDAYTGPLVNGSNHADIVKDNFYYTFITFTTTGYGDVVPKDPVSKSLAIMISVSGQLYLAVIIAMLVGKYASIGKKTL